MIHHFNPETCCDQEFPLILIMYKSKYNCQIMLHQYFKPKLAQWAAVCLSIIQALVKAFFSKYNLVSKLCSLLYKFACNAGVKK